MKLELIHKRLGKLGGGLFYHHHSTHNEYRIQRINDLKIVSKAVARFRARKVGVNPIRL